MLIKPKTTSTNLHQIVTLVVSRATVRFIYGELAHADTHARVCASDDICVLCVWSLSLCHAASVMMLVFFE